MPDKPDISYLLCIVKRNEGMRVRLAEVNSLLRFHYTGEDERTEIDIISDDVGKEDLTNELWQKNQMIWFSPMHPRIWEATQDDAQAKKEYKILCEIIDHIEDVDPEKQEKNGTLIRIFNEGGKFRVFDGQRRSVTFD